MRQSAKVHSYGDFAEALSRGIEFAVAPRVPRQVCDDLPTVRAGELNRPAPEPATTAVAGNLGSAPLADRRVLS
jgi:hypothetical protein